MRVGLDPRWTIWHWVLFSLETEEAPLDQLKIDQSYIRNVLNGVTDASIVRTIIDLGQSPIWTSSPRS
jgi:predicted signal transduction protein with EAL and GGDEF domain